MQIQKTRLESDEDVQQALRAYRLGGKAEANNGSVKADDAPPMFRPTERPAMAVLTVFDDGAEDGEQIRIRQDEYVIGRAKGDFVVPHDGQMSSRHASIKRVISGEKLRWHLVDLGSTNGTYVRINHAVLSHGQQFIIGRTRLQFDNPPATDSAEPTSADQTTRPWQRGANVGLVPSMVRLEEQGPGKRVMLAQGEAWVGKDSAYCSMTLTDDPFVSARHARIRRDDEGRWLIENNKSPNGVWLRVEKIRLTGSCRFLLGEQQFMLKIS